MTKYAVYLFVFSMNSLQPIATTLAIPLATSLLPTPHLQNQIENHWKKRRERRDRRRCRQRRYHCSSRRLALVAIDLCLRSCRRRNATVAALVFATARPLRKFNHPATRLAGFAWLSSHHLPHPSTVIPIWPGSRSPQQSELVSSLRYVMPLRILKL